MEQATKSVSVSFRISPLLNRCLEKVAAHEQRSHTSMLEKLVLDDCCAHYLAGLTEEPTSNNDPRKT